MCAAAQCILELLLRREGGTRCRMGARRYIRRQSRQPAVGPCLLRAWMDGCCVLHSATAHGPRPRPTVSSGLLQAHPYSAGGPDGPSRPIDSTCSTCSTAVPRAAVKTTPSPRSQSRRAVRGKRLWLRGRMGQNGSLWGPCQGKRFPSRQIGHGMGGSAAAWPGCRALTRDRRGRQGANGRR